MNRREFLYRAAAASAAGCLSFAAACDGEGGINGFGPLGIRPTNGPDPVADMQALVEKMVSFGPRLTGSSAHADFVDWLDAEFRALGFETKRDPHLFTHWLARSWSLSWVDGGEAIPVAAYYPYSGETSASGIDGDLVSLSVPLSGLNLDVSNPANPTDFIARFVANLGPTISALLAAVAGGVEGAIVLVDGIIPPLLTTIFLPLLTYARPEDLAGIAAHDYKRSWVALVTLGILDPLRAAGAAGAVFALDASPANALGQYLPFQSELNSLPALLVDRDVGDELRRHAASRPRIRLVLEADVEENVRSDSLVATLPGRSEENIIINTHSDGQNAFEENGAAACIYLARHLAAIPLEDRPRTFVFSLVTGHIGPTHLPETEGFIDDNPDLVRNAAAAVTIEHFGSREWLDDAGGYRATGDFEFAAAFHSITPIALIARDSLVAADLPRVALLRPIGGFFLGVGGELHAAGVPSIGFLAGPNYLVAIADDHHMDKFDAARMADEMAWIIDLVHRLERTPADYLKIGDATILGLTGG